MNTSGNTILITGGGSGIGRGLAEAFVERGDRVIIAGRRQAALDEVTRANPGMASMTLDIADAAAVEAFAAAVVRDHPALNVVINNAGVMRLEKLADAPAPLEDAEATVATNLLGPIRLTQALLPHLKTKARSSVVTVSSGLAFVPMAATPTYCATKAAIHSWSMSLRKQLTGTPVEVVEIIPPYVQTELISPGQKSDPHAMPLDAFVAEVMALIGEDRHDEIVVERCRPLRDAPRNGEVEAISAMFDGMTF